MMCNDKKVKKNFHNLVFAGGGVLGAAYIGVLEAIEKYARSINDINQIFGTSVGSIFSTVAALKYSTEEMKQIIDDLNFSKLADQGILSFESEDIFGSEHLNIASILDLIMNERGGFGANSGIFLEEWVDGLIATKVGKKFATFKDLKSNSKFSDLHIFAANITSHKIEHFSFRNTPDVIISKAVRASSSVPIFFDVVKMGGNILVDGGIYIKYPIGLVDSSSFYDTLGVDFTPHGIRKHPEVSEDNIKSKFGWEKYVIALMTSTFVAQDLNYKNTNDNERTIVVNDLGISPFNFDLNNQQKQSLYKEGYRAAEEYFLG